MIKEFIDFLKYESQYGFRVLCTDLVNINKLYFGKQHIEKLLRFASKHSLRFTFFVRSYSLDKKKGLIQEIKKQGHEIASHGHSHVLYENKTKSWMKKELVKSLDQFKRFNIDIKGFRSPFLSDNRFLYEVLYDLGFEYASNKFLGDKTKSILHHEHIIYPSDWHGLVVENWTIEKNFKKWTNKSGVLLLHPWIFVKYFDKLNSLIEDRKDLRIISNLGKNNLKISFDLY